MTKAQESLYWRRWGAVVRANKWQFAGGRLSDQAARGDRSEWHWKAWEVAEALALQEHRGVIANDLRHACHCLVGTRSTASHISHTALTNGQFSRLLCLWGNGAAHGRRMDGLLIDPECIRSLENWLHPEINERERTEARIRELAPDAYVRQVAADRFGSRNWENLHVDHLRQLLMTLKGRRHTFDAPAPDVARAASTTHHSPLTTHHPELASVEQPF